MRHNDTILNIENHPFIFIKFSFLVKQGHASAVCQLNLRGFDDELAVISASTDNIDIMDGIIKKTAERLGVGIDAVRPEDWLQTFYDERKGSGKKASANVMRNAD